MVESQPVEACLHAWVGGQVQGVGFRMFVQEQAVKMDVKGWVRNRWDGRVEVMVEGERNILEQFLGQLRRGPRSAYVSELQFDWLAASGDLYGFTIRRTE